MNPLKIIKNGIIDENPTLVQCIGLCPTLAVSTSAINGFGMGIAATAVLIGSNMAVSAIRKFVPDEIRIPIFIVVIAGFVTVAQLLISGFAPALDASLGIFIPLIVVNCIILARSEAFAFKNGVLASAADGIGMGLGFTLALTLFGAVREVLGNGTVFNIQVTPDGFQPALLVILAPGGFIALGTFMALFRVYQRWSAERKGEPVPDVASGCAACDAAAFCVGGVAVEAEKHSAEKANGPGGAKLPEFDGLAEGGAR
ncbi:MAG: electron transport complex subunit E [Synergistaceae bacterium]|jgi:electron transport complex protein RnfE|nr:electron transport complex subunit E [Synergistaceae bacterium]